MDLGGSESPHVPGCLLLPAAGPHQEALTLPPAPSGKPSQLVCLWWAGLRGDLAGRPGGHEGPLRGLRVVGGGWGNFAPSELWLDLSAHLQRTFQRGDLGFISTALLTSFSPGVCTWPPLHLTLVLGPWGSACPQRRLHLREHHPLPCHRQDGRRGQQFH